MDKRTIYDDIADVFMASLTAQMSGITRADFLRRIRTAWPTEDEARKHWAELCKRGEAFAEQAERDAKARGNTIIGVGYPVKKQ